MSPATAEKTRLHLMHWSAQFSDTREQKRQDCEKVFSRARGRKVSWVTGTEAGQRELRFAAAPRQDAWLAVDRRIITGDWGTFYEKTMSAGEGRGHHSARGCFAADFDAGRLGHVTVIPYHLLTRGRPEGPPQYRVNLPLNKRMMEAIGEYAIEMGAGPKNLVFIGADTNIPTKSMDEFLGQPFVSAQSDLNQHPGTGHGPIDTIGYLRGDSNRIDTAYLRVLDDSEFHLHGDHFLLEAGFDVVLLPEPAPQPVTHPCPSCGFEHKGLLKSA
jgi:hypothetical protein